MVWGLRTRPADVLAANWILWKPAAFYVAVTSRLFYLKRMTAAFVTEVRKRQANDGGKCAEVG